jgi:hypothetical protein
MIKSRISRKNESWKTRLKDGNKESYMAGLIESNK